MLQLVSYSQSKSAAGEGEGGGRRASRLMAVQMALKPTRLPRHKHASDAYKLLNTNLCLRAALRPIPSPRARAHGLAGVRTI
jgi:hypothetical protein